MDGKDFRLLVALHEDARASYRTLGRRVSLTAPAVRERVRRMQEKGVFKGFWLTPDPQVVGREDLLVLFTDRSREDLARALAVPEVAWVAWKMDGGLTVQMWPRDPERATRELASSLGAAPANTTIAEPTPHAPVSALDWRIVEALVDDPRLPLEMLCARTRLSPKTVRKHLAQLRQEHAIYITPMLGSLGEAGEIVFPLLVFGNARVSELRGAMGDALLLNETEIPPMKYFLCRSQDMGEVTDRVQRVRKLAGVDSAVVTLNREMVVNKDFIRAVVHEQVR